jgi:hypothetical protein
VDRPSRPGSPLPAHTDTSVEAIIHLSSNNTPQSRFAAVHSPHFAFLYGSQVTQTLDSEPSHHHIIQSYNHSIHAPPPCRPTLHASHFSHRSRPSKSSPPRRSGTQVALGKSKVCVTGFSRWVKGQAQGMEPGGFKLWVNWICELVRGPHRGAPTWASRPGCRPSQPAAGLCSL